MEIVMVDLNSTHLLTAERMQPGPSGSEVPAGYLCDANGVTLQKEHHHRVPKIYLDMIRGEYFMLIDHEEKERIARSGEQEIFQGAGAHSGWFVVAPDYTIHGRHGERAPKTNVVGIETAPHFEQWTAPKNFAKPPRVAAHAPAAPAKRAQVRRMPGKKAAKKTAGKKSAAA